MKPLVVLVLSIVLLGCTGLQKSVDPVTTAKSLQKIQSFIDEHPDAKIISQYLTKDKAATQLKKYPECELVDAQALYFVTFKDEQLSAAAFVSMDQRPLCLVTMSSRVTPGPAGATETPTVTSEPLSPLNPTPQPSAPVQGKCAQVGQPLNDAVNPDGPTDYLKCCPGLVAYLRPGDVAGVCLLKENVPTPTPTPAPRVPIIHPFEYPGDLPDSTSLKAIDLKQLFGCSDVKFDLNSSRWLNPKLPIASCLYDINTIADKICRSRANPENPNDFESRYACIGVESELAAANFTPKGTSVRIISSGSAMPIYERYVVLIDGTPRLISNASQFFDVFGSVDSPAEAVAFADLLNAYPGLKVDLNAEFVKLYGKNSQFDYNSDYVYLVSEINGTHAEPTADGYVVNFFDTFPGDCSGGISQVNLIVRTDGMVSKSSIVDIAKNEGPMMCY